MVCGLPGSGKSYFMTNEIVKARNRGKKIFTNYPIKGCYVLKYEDLIRSAFPENSLICIDEANTWFNSRKWKDFPVEAFSFFMHHRHFKLDMILIAQIPTTIDVNIRDIVTYYIWSKALYLPFTDKVMLFNYYYFYSVDDLVNFRNVYRVDRILPRKKVFDEFDTYYKFVELQRKQINMDEWKIIK
jgi:zona occludens toxin (predicted ATPase)